MLKILALAVLLAAASCHSKAQGLPFPGFVVAASSGTITAKQNWGTFAFGVAATKDFVFGSVPTVGDVIACAAGTDSTGLTLGISDNMTDGGTWNTIIGPVTQLNTAYVTYLFYKIMGATANSNKTVTITPAVGVPHLEITCIELQTTSGTFSLDGTAVQGTTTGTNPAPTTPNSGVITTTTPTSYVFSYVVDDTNMPTAATGYTRQVTTNNFNNDAVEDQYTSAAGAYTPSWIDAASVHNIVLGAAFKAN